MSDLQTSPEQVAAANEFNARRERDAKDWNNQSQTHGSGLASGAAPIVTMPNGRAGLNSEALQDAADSWKAPEEPEATTPDNVIDIASHPNFHRVESSDAPQPEEHKSVEQEVGEVLASEALHPIEAAQKSSELIDTLLDNPAAFQKNTIEIINFMSTPGLSDNNKERLSSILLQELQNPDRPIDIDSINSYLAALATMKNEKSDLWQSTLQVEGERVLEAKYDHIRKNRKATSSHSVGSELPAAQPVPPTVENKPTPPERTPLKTAAELAQEGTLTERIQKEQTAAQADNSSAEVVPPPQATEAAGATVSTNEQPTNNEDAERLQAEINAELDKRQKLTLEIQSAWRDLPPGAQNSLALSRLPKTAGFLDLTSFAAQLEQRMDNAHLQANNQFAGLNGEGLEVKLARSKRINQEFDKLLLDIEHARLESPEVKTGVAEADKIRAKHAENLEKMQAKLSKHLADKPWLRDLVKLDPHVQKNPYFSKYGQNELGLK